MGYTHYWRLKPTILPTEAVLLLGELLWHAYTVGVVQYEFNDPQPPLVSDTEIRFNGVGEQGYETFRFLATAVGQPDSVRTVQFCKTARKPYDEVVMQVLIVLKHYLGEAITVTSDGDFDVEWADPRREIEHRYGIRTINGQQLDEELVAAWGIKELLRQVLAAPSSHDARHRLTRFYQAVLAADMPEATRLAEAISTCWPEIEAFLRLRFTNARTEGGNRVIKQLKRVGCGYRNQGNYETPYPPAHRREERGVTAINAEVISPSTVESRQCCRGAPTPAGS